MTTPANPRDASGAGPGAGIVASRPDVEIAGERGGIRAGNPLPVGAYPSGDGVNFALFSRHATRVSLEFYERPDDATPNRVIDLDPPRHRTGDVWHVWVRGVPSGQLYGYRIDGPYRPEEGRRFNVHKLLLDPYATAIAGVQDWDFVAARGYDPSSDRVDLSFSTVDNAVRMPLSWPLRKFYGEDPRVDPGASWMEWGHPRSPDYLPSLAIDPTLLYKTEWSCTRHYCFRL